METVWRESSELEGRPPSKKLKYDHYLPTPSQSTGPVEGSVEGEVEGPVETSVGPDERQVTVPVEGSVEGPSAPHTEGPSKMVESHPPATIEVVEGSVEGVVEGPVETSVDGVGEGPVETSIEPDERKVEGPSASHTEGPFKMVESHPPATIEEFKQWVLKEEDISKVMLKYVRLQTANRKLKLYQRVSHWKPTLYGVRVELYTSIIDNVKASIESLIVEGSYDKVIEWLDSSGRHPSKKCKSDDVLPPLSQENTDENTEETDEPPTFTDLKQLILEECYKHRVVCLSVTLQSYKLSLEICERLYHLNPKHFRKEIQSMEMIIYQEEMYLKDKIVEGGCDKLMEVIENC